jgi:hypothetical protein
MRYYLRLALVFFCFQQVALFANNSAVRAQNRNSRVLASDLFPFLPGNYVEYDSYVTDTNGIAASAVSSHASSNVLTNDLNFAGISDVAVVADTLPTSGSNTNTVSSVRYIADAVGDIHAYADQNFLALFAPPSVVNAVTPPDSFVTYISLANGIDNPYHIFSLSQKANYQGLPLTIKIELAGEFRGIERLKVPAGEFDSAYHFSIIVDLKAMIDTQTVTELKNVQEFWFVSGIGIVKSVAPTATNPFITVQGAERVMVDYKKPTVVQPEAVAQSSSTRASTLFPNPANFETAVRLDAKTAMNSNWQIDLYSSAGTLVRSLLAPVGSQGTVSINTQNLPSADYLVVIRSGNTPPESQRLSVTH